MDEPNRCHGCGQTRPVDATGDLCPLCRLRSGARVAASEEGRSDGDDLLVTSGPESSSVLDTIRQTIGRVPEVHAVARSRHGEPPGEPRHSDRIDSRWTCR